MGGNTNKKRGGKDAKNTFISRGSTGDPEKPIYDKDGKDNFTIVFEEGKMMSFDSRSDVLVKSERLAEGHHLAILYDNVKLSLPSLSKIGLSVSPVAPLLIKGLLASFPPLFLFVLPPILLI
jgi:hypothetical protein